MAENEDHCIENEDDFITPSQVSSKSSQSWVANHPSIVDKKLRPSISYWIALAPPNGAPANPIIVHRALLECGVDAIANQVNLFLWLINYSSFNLTDEFMLPFSWKLRISFFFSHRISNSYHSSSSLFNSHIIQIARKEQRCTHTKRKKKLRSLS